MQEMDKNLDEEVRLWQEKLFTRSVRRTQKLDRILNLTGKTSNLQCLEISAGDGVISANLRSLGGSWKTFVVTEREATSLSFSLNEKVSLIDNCALPFEEHTFDRVVIVDALKGIGEDDKFLQECHRVLKNDGWVIISEERRCPISFVALLQRMFNSSPISQGHRRNGYSSRELFNILRDGFDVPEIICYTNGLLESLATIGSFLQQLIMHEHYWLVREKVGQDELYRYRKLYSLAGFAYPLLWLISKLEFLPGHKLLVKSRRRHWRPRLQPKLLDGRSIAEAAINTKIGTAAPF
jgi:SAM-dependent methyltransferase